MKRRDFIKATGAALATVALPVVALARPVHVWDVMAEGGVPLVEAIPRYEFEVMQGLDKGVVGIKRILVNGNLVWPLEVRE